MQKVAKLEDWKRDVREGFEKREREAKEAKVRVNLFDGLLLGFPLHSQKHEIGYLSFCYLKRQNNSLFDVLQEKKERLMEEVRQIFGFRIDPKDERFKEALLQKEREEKRAAKEAKKIERQQKMMENLRKAAQKSSSQEMPESSDGLKGTPVVENSLPPPPVQSKE